MKIQRSSGLLVQEPQVFAGQDIYRIFLSFFFARSEWSYTSGFLVKFEIVECSTNICRVHMDTTKYESYRNWILSFISPSTIPGSVHTMKIIGFNLEILAQWPQGLPRWNDAKCKQTHSQNLSIKAIYWIETRVSKLFLFTQRSHSSFIRPHLSFIFETRFLGVQIWKKIEKKLEVLKLPDSSHNENPRVHPQDFNFSRI